MASCTTCRSIPSAFARPSGTTSGAACHAPSGGFTGPDSDINAGGSVYPGAIPTRFGNRKPPAAAYAFGPVLYYDDEEGLWIGGTFWDLMIALEAQLGQSAGFERTLDIFYTVMQRSSDIPTSACSTRSLPPWP